MTRWHVHLRWWSATLILAAGLAIMWGLRREGAGRADPAMPPPRPEAALLPPSPDLWTLAFPTRQTRLADTNLAGVFQPTAAGTPESGTYGTVRMGQVGKQLLPRFHEGVDIAALERDRAGRPLDDVFAALHGTVAFMNRVAGNSDYGRYIVLTHHDPAGPFYTLYGHLAELDAGLREGDEVDVGARLGRMGNTAIEPIPMARAHLHFEIGMIYNQHFLSWPGRARKQTPGGLYNGQNLAGLNPILVFRDRDAVGRLTLLEHLGRLPAAFEIVVSTRRLPDFFARHPALWQGEAYQGPALVLTVAEGGAPLKGRTASEADLRRLGRQRACVLSADPAVLGRNGRRLVVNRQGAWTLGSNGETWLDLLLHHP